MPSLYSAEHKLAFIHVPKTGGTSVSLALRDYRTPWNVDQWTTLFSRFPGGKEYHAAGHTLAADFQRYVPDWSEISSFAFVRNPFDWIVSLYYYRVRLGETRVFVDWFDAKIDENAEQNNQRSYLIDTDDALLVQNVFLFKDLKRGFSTMCERVNIPLPSLPHVNRSSRTKICFDRSRRSRMEVLFAPDFQLFESTEAIP